MNGVICINLILLTCHILVFAIFFIYMENMLMLMFATAPETTEAANSKV